MSRLNHPHIIATLGAGMSRNPPFVLYELMGGGTMEEFLDHKRSKNGMPHAPPM